MQITHLERHRVPTRIPVHALVQFLDQGGACRNNRERDEQAELFSWGEALGEKKKLEELEENVEARPLRDWVPEALVELRKWAKVGQLSEADQGAVWMDGSLQR